MKFALLRIGKLDPREMQARAWIEPLEIQFLDSLDPLDPVSSYALMKYMSDRSWVLVGRNNLDNPLLIFKNGESYAVPISAAMMLDLLQKGGHLYDPRINLQALQP